MAQRQIPHFDGVIDMEMTPEDQLAADEQKIQDEIYSEFLADDKSEWIVTVNKVNPQTKKQQTCFKMSPGELPGLFERLRDEFGPGEYRAYVSKNGKVTRNLGYDIAAPIKKTDAQMPSQIGEIANLIARQNEQLANIMRGTPAAPVDPMAMFTGMMGAIASMKEVFAAPQPANAGSSIKDFMEMLAFAKEIVADGGGGGRSAFDLAAEFLRSPIAGELAEQFKAQRSAPQSPVISPSRAMEIPALKGPITSTAQSPVISASPMPEILAEFDQATLAQMKQQVDFWVSRAARDCDPGLYADLLLDTLPTDFAANFIGRPDLIDGLAFLNPAVTQYLAWFGEFRAAVLNILTDGDGGDDKGGAVAESNNVSNQSGKSSAIGPDGNTIGPGRGGSDAGDHVAPRQRGKKASSNS